MSRMTIERLEQYRTIKRQIELHDKGDDISFLSAVDTSKPSVQNNKISDTTADIAIKLCEEITEKEYQELCEEFQILHSYIYGISDFLVREIAKLRFVEGKEFDEIGKITHYSEKHCSRILKKYVPNVL